MLNAATVPYSSLNQLTPLPSSLLIYPGLMFQMTKDIL